MAAEIGQCLLLNFLNHKNHRRGCYYVRNNFLQMWLFHLLIDIYVLITIQVRFKTIDGLQIIEMIAWTCDIYCFIISVIIFIYNSTSSNVCTWLPWCCTGAGGRSCSWSDSPPYRWAARCPGPATAARAGGLAWVQVYLGCKCQVCFVKKKGNKHQLNTLNFLFS